MKEKPANNIEDDVKDDNKTLKGNHDESIKYAVKADVKCKDSEDLQNREGRYHREYNRWHKMKRKETKKRNQSTKWHKTKVKDKN